MGETWVEETWVEETWVEETWVEKTWLDMSRMTANASARAAERLANSTPSSSDNSRSPKLRWKKYSGMIVSRSTGRPLDLGASWRGASVTQVVIFWNSGARQNAFT